MSAYDQTLHPPVFKEICAGERRGRALRLFRKLPYLFTPLLVCWHRKMSRPFTRDGETYRVCLRCGMHRKFDLQQWQTKGEYYNARVRHDASLRESKPRILRIIKT
jgi:hypothetical protein